MINLYIKNIKIITEIEKTIKNISRQDYTASVNNIIEVSAGLSDIFSRVIENKNYFRQNGLNFNDEMILSELKELLDSQEREDYILYGDLLRLQVLPNLIQIQETIRLAEGEDVLLHVDENRYAHNMDKLYRKDVELYGILNNNDEDKNRFYKIEATTVGALTLRVSEESKSYYMHSNYNPYEEAENFANYYYNSEKEEYLVYGLGLGYHVEALAQKDKNMRIIVYENDIEIIKKFLLVREVDWYLNNPNIRIIWDRDYSKLGKVLRNSPEQILIVHRPSLKFVNNSVIFDSLEEYVLRDNLSRYYSNLFEQNSRINFKYCDRYADELKNKFKGKRILIVAGGPSLDKNIYLLRNKPEDMIVFAVGAVAKKLMGMKIRPDYIVVTDPKQKTVFQLDGLWEEEIPLFITTTAAGEISKKYKGKKYLVCQRGYDKAEENARARKGKIFDTGGSVATTALDICIQFEAAIIICIGLDLAFTENKMHVSDGGEQGSFVDIEEMLSVSAVGGGVVNTSKPFNRYRKWIEKRVKKDDVKMLIYDATEGGANIDGLVNISLKDILKLEKKMSE